MGIFNNPTYTSFLICIVIVVILGCIAAYRLKAGAEEDDGSTTDDELRKGFERAFFQGEIDAAEYKRVMAALDAKNAGVKPILRPEAPAIVPVIPPGDEDNPAAHNPSPPVEPEATA